MAQLMTNDEKDYYRSQTELAKSQIQSLKNQDKISKEQLKISKNQNQTLENQTKFSKILMIATAVLALGTFLALTLEITKFQWSLINSTIGAILTTIFVLFFLVLFCIMTFLIWRVLIDLTKK